MITLHHVPMSRSFRISWLLEELGLDYQTRLYSIRDGSLRAPEFLAISPAGRVPALEMDGEVLFESSAILQTLCERKGSDLMPPVGHPDRARTLEMLSYGETMASLIEQLNIQHLFLRDPADASPVVIKLTTARLRATLAGFDGMLGESEYLLPSGFSVADIMMGFNLLAAPYYVRFDAFPRLSAYRARCEARSAFRAALAQDGEHEFYTKDFYPVPEAT